MSYRGLPDSKLFEGLSTAELEELLRVAYPIRHNFKQGDTVWFEGDVLDGIGLLKEGALLCQRNHPDGTVQFVRVCVPGSILNIETGVSQSKVSPVSVVATGAGSYAWFPYASLFDNPEVAPRTVRALQANLLACLADEAIRFIKRMGILQKHTVRAKVVTYLDILREMQGDKVSFGMAQKELAHYLCVDRSSLSEELGKMRREGLIEFKGTFVKIKYPDARRKPTSQIEGTY